MPRLLATVALFAAAGCKVAPPPPAADGNALFAAACARCHGPLGRGGLASDGGPPQRDFHDPAFSRRSDR
ncbi:MAG: c-type cytochrome [Myxococcales bacterium]|nr:c-type cytochrome [Myxococcales bacterium]